MEIIPLGGTDVGASSLYLAIDDHGFVVDAGVRYEDRDPLPNYALLERAPYPVDAVFITHAHQDHTGSLPVLSRLYPDAPIFMTQATLAIVRVMLADALNLADAGIGPRLFDETDVEKMWDRVRVLPQDRDLNILGTRVTTYSAGHILGAVAIGFTNPKGSVLITGDFSVRPGRLLPGGLRFPKGLHYDTVVTESTYGARMHPNRSEQERTLVEQVARVVGSGSFVLIPAFAVGRAQEVLVILQEAMRHNPEVPKFPLIVDGLVRRINNVYGAYPHLLNGPMRRLVHQEGQLFDSDFVRPVRNGVERRAVLAGKPSCIIASSGMLNGGPSVYYAEALGPGSQNAILLCGYQDEESPGRALMNLSQTPPEERAWRVGGRLVPIRAQLGFYSLSAHADREEIVTALAPLNPGQVIILHGDRESRLALAERFRSRDTSVYTPEVGEPVAIHPSGKKYGAPRVGAPQQVVVVASEQEPGLEVLYVTARQGDDLRATDSDGRVRDLSADQILLEAGRVPWGQSPVPYLTVLKQGAKVALSQNRIYGARPEERIAYAIAQQTGRLAPSALLATIADTLDPYGFRRTQADFDARTLSTFCHFPWAVPEKLLQTLQRQAEDVDWSFRLAREIYSPALIELISHFSETPIRVGTPHVYPTEKRAVIPIETDQKDTAALAQAVGERIGGTVTFVPLVSTTADTPEASRWEQNAASAQIREAAPESWRLQRVAIFPTEGRMELVVTFPDTLTHNSEFDGWCRQLAEQTGWHITLARRGVNQRALADRAQMLTGSSHQPSLYLEEKAVGVRISEEYTADQFAAAAAQFARETGWQLKDERVAKDPVNNPRPATDGRQEVNQAMEHIRQVAEAIGLPLQKVSKRGDTLELFCVTPESASPYQAALEHLSEETGWPIHVARRVHQGALMMMAQRAIGQELSAPPSLRAASQEVAVRLGTTVPEQAQSLFFKKTGWHLING